MLILQVLYQNSVSFVSYRSAVSSFYLPQKTLLPSDSQTSLRIYHYHYDVLTIQL
jgi:hypothetical protein